MPDYLIVILAILLALLLIGLIAAWAYGFARTKVYLRLLWWKARGAKRAPEIPAGEIAQVHPDAADARAALNERLQRARDRARVETTPVIIRPDETPAELSEGDDIVLLDPDGTDVEGDDDPTFGPTGSTRL